MLKLDYAIVIIFLCLAHFLFGLSIGEDESACGQPVRVGISVDPFAHSVSIVNPSEDSWLLFIMFRRGDEGKAVGAGDVYIGPGADVTYQITPRNYRIEMLKMCSNRPDPVLTQKDEAGSVIQQTTGETWRQPT